MKTALIFGVSGQDGALLSRLLLEKGYRVVGVSRDAMLSRFQNLDKVGVKDHVELVSASINDFRSVLHALKNHQPDEVYNLAGQSSVGLSFEHPVETFESISIANLNLLEAIRFLNFPVKFYNACSSEMFGNTDGKAVDEASKLNPRSPYAVAKAASYWQTANYREAYDLFACSGILFNHESWLRPDRFVTRKVVKSACRISRGSDEKLYLGDMSIERDWGWAPEYVEGMWLMLQQKKAEDFLLATGQTNRLEDFVCKVFDTLGLSWHDHVCQDRSLLRPADIVSIRANPEKAKRKLGWNPRFKMADVAEKMVSAELEGMHSVLTEKKHV